MTERTKGRSPSITGTPDRSAQAFTGRRATLAAMAVILIVALAYFSQIVFAGKILTGGDVLAGAAIFEDYATERLAAGHVPLWNPYIFSGMPFFENTTWNAMVYPSYWLGSLIESIPGVDLPRLFFLFLHYVLAGFGMFFFLRSRKVGHAGATIGGVAFMLTPHLVGLATIGHGGKVMTAAYIPLVLMATQRLLDTAGRRWMAALALVGGLQFLARHVQVSYYTWLAVGIFVVYYLISARREGEAWGSLGRKVAMVAGAGVLAACLAGVLLIPLQQYSLYSTRAASAGGMGFEQATMWSFHPKEILTFLVPSLYGLANETYWGTMPFEQVSHYFGYTVLCLAIIAAVKGRRRSVGPLVALFLVSLFFSFGRHIGPIYRVLYDVLPGFSRFRVPAMFLLLSQFAAAALAGHGTSIILGEMGERKERWALWAAGAAGLGIVTALIVMGIRSELVSSASAALLSKHAGADPSILRGLAARAAELAAADARLLLVISLCTGLLVYVAGARKRIARRLPMWAVALAVLAVVIWDGAVVGSRFMRPETMRPLSSYYPASAATRYLKAQPGIFRIAPVGRDFSSNAWMYHRIESIGGYHAAKLALPDQVLQSVGIGNLKLLAMFNVKYVVGPEEIEHPLFTEVAPGVHEFSGTLPRAFLIGEARPHTIDSLALRELQLDSFDPSEYALVKGELPGPVEADPDGTVEITSYEPEEIRIRADVARPCLLVLSEVYYPPGWKAFIDGDETTIYRTNYAFRSVYLEPGEHTVVMRYSSASLKLGIIVTAAAAALLVLLAALPGPRKGKGVTS